ncbi:hypothetical protein NIES4103_66850 [Nostoc sp. NIES-4103]|nr:hypothetical protein NIES4103_66850 [Nostoc sp. NIES-4103]
MGHWELGIGEPARPRGGLHATCSTWGDPKTAVAPHERLAISRVIFDAGASPEGELDFTISHHI